MAKHLNRLVVSCSLLGASPLCADQFHYNNIIIGDRALGLGGAYTAIADDASGVYYNPAGLGFALSNDISGSANAFYKRVTRYKDTIGDEPFDEESNGSMAPFFGGLQKDLIPGFIFAFGIATIDSDLKDQNDLLGGKTFTSETKKGQKVQAYLSRLHRVVMARASTSNFSIAAARRFGGSFSFGFGLSYVTIDELVQEYQDNQVAASETATGQSQVIQNLRENLSAIALEPSIGIQWAFLSNWSMGLTYKHPITVTESLKREIESTKYAYSWTDSSRTEQTPTPDANGKVAIKRTEVISEIKKPLGELPKEIRLGVAWFASPRLLMSSDVVQKTAAKSGDWANYEREAVTNYALGVEYYVTPAIPVRWGLFTNYDARPELDENKYAQRDHIDYIGTSLFFAWVQPNSQVALGGIYQVGDGEAQKLGDFQIQKVESTSVTYAFSATHNF
ncbi:MAG: OmpP1/FadL family transporter [Oligoflexales bacterium]